MIILKTQAFIQRTSITSVKEKKELAFEKDTY